MNDPAAVCRAAAAYIREHGLAKHILYVCNPSDVPYYGPLGAACFNGALLIALGGNSEAGWAELWKITMMDDQVHARTFRLISDTAEGILADRGYEHDPVNWNNEAERTAEDVAGLLDETAAVLEAA